MSDIAHQSHQPSRRACLLILSAVFLFTLAFQYPSILDFQKFGFYDEGAWLRLDQLFSQGRIPTVDLGYSYGMLPLILSHGWFALFGRSPVAFVAFMSVCNLFSVAAIAIILHATGASWQRLWAACVLLPLAVQPSNYSLMHPLEMALILWAIACQARGRYAGALAFAVAAVLTKPSMPYVLGLLLLIFGILLRQPRQTAPAPHASLVATFKSRLAANWHIIILPALTAVGLLVLSILAVGFTPAFANILPLTGGRSYQQMNFGIFHAGRSFWLKTDGGLIQILKDYIGTPALFWILASLLVWTLGTRAGYRLWRRQVGQAAPRPNDPLVFILAALHAAFVFVFYAWAGSWTYYAYLPVLGLLVGLRGHRQNIMLRVLLVIALFGLIERFGGAYGRWWDLNRSLDTGSLYSYSDLMKEAHDIREIGRQRKTLLLVNGYLPLLWPEAKTPEVWFVSPGIPTLSEINRIRKQIEDADVVVLFKKYDQNQEAWFWPEFAEQRKPFALRTFKFGTWSIQEAPLYGKVDPKEGGYLIAYARHAPSASRNVTTSPGK